MNIKIQQLCNILLLSLIIAQCTIIEAAQQPQAQAPHYHFQSHHAAPLKDTLTDEAAAEYFRSLAEDPNYKTAKDLASVVNHDYIAPSLQPVVNEWRQWVYKTQHEQRMEDKEKLEIEQIKSSTKSHEASEINTKLNSLLSYCQNCGNKDKAIKEECDALIKQFGDIQKKQVDDLFAATFGKEEKKLSETTVDENKSQNTESKSENFSPEQNKTTTPDDLNESQNTKNGLLARLGALLVPSFAVTGIDSIAKTCGAQATAEWLATKAPFFNDKQQTVSRTLAFGGTVAACVAVYKLYEAFTSEDDEEDEEDIFSFTRKN